MAVAGTLKTTLGFKPLMKDWIPPCLYKPLAAVKRPFASGMLFVCKTVLIQSNGVVIAAAKAPEIPPLTQWIIGL